MATIEIYTSPLCGYCHRVKHLLTEKGVEFTEINVAMNMKKRKEMTQRADGARSVPQVFINDQHVGGCDELYALEREGRLDPLLAA